MAKEKKDNKVKCTSPLGMFSFPYLAAPDSGRPESDNKHKVDLLIKKEVFKTEGKAMTEAVLQVAREYFGKPKIQLKDFKNPFMDMDTVDGADDRTKGHIRVRAKSEYQPLIVGADKEELSADDIKKIKGGDFGRIVCVAYPYSQQGGGVTLGLNLVQYARPGEALGQGRKAYLDMIDEIEVTLDDVETEEAEEETKSVSSNGHGTNGKASRGRPKKVLEPEPEESEVEDEEADFQFS